jgi:hypothetical protein
MLVVARADDAGGLGALVWGTWHDKADHRSATRRAVARVQGISINALNIDSLASEIERVRADKDFTTRARKLLQRDKELLDRLAR